MKYSFLLVSILLLSSCGAKPENPTVTVPETPTETATKIPSIPAPENLSAPILDASGTMTCPAGLVLVTDSTPVRCEYDNRPL